MSWRGLVITIQRSGSAERKGREQHTSKVSSVALTRAGHPLRDAAQQTQ